MSKIFIVAKQVKNEVKFISSLRKITGQSIAEIRQNLKNQKPFFKGYTTGNTQEETEVQVNQILDFTTSNGDSIKFYEIMDDASEFFSEKDEISKEDYESSVIERKKTSSYFEELDELEAKRLEKLENYQGSKSFYITSMPETRPADYHLGYLEGSVFIDFNHVDDRIYLQRISFDGYGCCDLGTKAAPLDQKDSSAFKEAIKDIVNHLNILDTLVRKSLKLNHAHIWTRALQEYFDL